jgi:hypothetical protein
MTKKLGKLKPKFPKDAKKVVAEIYKMYDEMSKIAIELGKKKDSFMRNPDTWMVAPDKMVQRGDYDMLGEEYTDAVSFYNEALDAKKKSSSKRKSPKKRSSKRKSSKRKSPKKKSPKKRSSKKKSPKRKSPKRKRKSKRKIRSPRKTVAQTRKECKAKGLVYDRYTRKCRESKRKRRKSKSPKRKRKSVKLKKKSTKRRKSVKRKSPRRKSVKRKSPKKRRRAVLKRVSPSKVTRNVAFTQRSSPRLSGRKKEEVIAELLAVLGYSSVRELCAAQGNADGSGMTEAQKKYMKKLDSLERKYQQIEEDDVLDWDNLDDDMDDEMEEDDDDMGDYSL